MKPEVAKPLAFGPQKAAPKRKPAESPRSKQGRTALVRRLGILPLKP